MSNNEASLLTVRGSRPCCKTAAIEPWTVSRRSTATFDISERGILICVRRLLA